MESTLKRKFFCLSLLLFFSITSSLLAQGFYTSPYQSKSFFLKENSSVFKKPESLSQLDWFLIQRSISKASQKYGVSRNLIYALVKKESSFNPQANSSSGARGLTQLMPRTAKSECNLNKEQLFEIDLNIDCGVSYLNKQLNDFGREDLALAAYNAGPNAVRKAIKKTSSSADIFAVTRFLKPETRPYVRKILAYAASN